MTRTHRWIAVGVAAIVVLVVGGVVMATRNETYAFHGGEYQPPKAAAALDLADQNGEPFSLADQQGKVLLVYFGYTTCPTSARRR